MNAIKQVITSVLVWGVAIAANCVYARSEQTRVFNVERSPFGSLSLENNPINAEADKTDRIWDFSSQSVVADKLRNSAKIHKNVYFEDIEGCCRAYVLRGDSLFFRGYNLGRSQHVLTDAYFPVLKLPLQVGDTHTNSYSGQGRYCVDYCIFDIGIHETEVVVSGRAVLNSGDTINDVYLIKERFDYKQKICVKTTNAEADSTVRHRSIIYRWITKHSVLPIAVQIVCDEEESPGTMTHNPARLYVTGSSNTAGKDDNAADKTSDESIQQTLQATEVSVNSGHLEVTFPTVTTEADINIHLLDISGNIYATQSQHLDPDGNNRYIFDVSTATHGRYIVAVCHAQKPSLNHKIGITL